MSRVIGGASMGMSASVSSWRSDGESGAGVDEKEGSGGGRRGAREKVGTGAAVTRAQWEEVTIGVVVDRDRDDHYSCAEYMMHLAMHI